MMDLDLLFALIDVVRFVEFIGRHVIEALVIGAGAFLGLTIVASSLSR